MSSFNLKTTSSLLIKFSAKPKKLWVMIEESQITKQCEVNKRILKQEMPVTMLSDNTRGKGITQNVLKMANDIHFKIKRPILINV